MISEQELKRRRLTYRLVQVVLAVLTIGIIAAFVMRRVPERRIVVETDVPAVELLSPGDVQILNVDESVDLILRGDKILAGLSPKTVARVRSELEKSAGKDTSGIAGIIASAVKEQVADKIGTHVVYDIRDIRDIRYENERIIVDWRSGREQALFGSVKVDRGDANRFQREDALRFIELVKARQRQIR